MPALCLKFTRSGKADLQRNIVQVISQMTPQMDPGLELMTDLMMLMRSAADESVRMDLARLIAILRRPAEPSPQKAPPRGAPQPP
jgi:hypothetical protein